jgi:hypothetical protein
MISGENFFNEVVSMTPREFTGLSAESAFFQPTSVADSVAQLKDYVQASLKSYDPPPIRTVLQDKQSRYKGMSALQKAIRRGNVELAQRAAHALWASGFESAFWYRLAIITYEDVGIADPVPCAVGNLLASDREWRATLDQRKALFWAVEQLCGVPKSRDACLFEVYADLPNCPERAAAHEMAANGADLDIARYANGEASGSDQFVAHWLIFGGGLKANWFGRKVPFRAGLVKDLTSQWKIPAVVRACALLHHSATAGSMQISTYYLWCMLRSSQTLQQGQDFFGPPDDARIGNVYAAAFDKHVSEGKRALGWFAKANAPVSEFCAKHGLNAYQFAATAAFYVEGAVLDRRVHFDRAECILGTLLQHRMQSIGSMSLALTIEGFDLFRSQLPELNSIRNQILKSRAAA